MATRLASFHPSYASIRNSASRFQRKFSGQVCIFRNSSSFKKELNEVEKHAGATYLNWKNVSVLVALPLCSYLFYKNIIVGEHIEKPKEFIPYPHLRIRNKPFPWGDGDKSLFHNAEYNLGPDSEISEDEEVADEEEEHVPFMTRLILKFQETEEEQRAWRDAHLRRCRQSAIENMERKRKPDLPMVPLDMIGLYDKQEKPKRLNVDA
eukprot:gene15186-16751_t